eukprot:508662-Pleurochrysis_carterae.AAC.2
MHALRWARRRAAAETANASPAAANASPAAASASPALHARRRAATPRLVSLRHFAEAAARPMRNRPSRRR